MNNPNSPSSLNPYQPPADLDPRLEFERAFVEQSSVAFSGAAVEGDLAEFLNSYDSVNRSTIAAGFIFLALLQLWSIMIGSFFALTVAGGVLLAALMAMTSSRAYRALVFRSANPNWRDQVSGELATEGIRIDRGFESCFYRWTWFSGVVIADHMVAFVPALSSDAPILISESMLPASVSLEQLKSFARSAKVICENRADGASVDWAIQQVMKSPDRERHGEIPANAIGFEGFVTGADIRTLPQSIRQPSRPLRAHLVRLLAMLGITGLVLGALLMFGQLGVGRAGLAVWILCGVIFLIVLRSGDRRRTALRDGSVFFFLVAYADDEAVVTDYFVSITRMPWGNITIRDQSPHRVVLGQQSSRHILIARRDMFGSSNDWQRFVDLVKTNVTRRAGDGGATA